MKYLLTFGILISAFGIASAQNPWGAFVKKKGDTMKGNLDYDGSYGPTNAAVLGVSGPAYIYPPASSFPTNPVPTEGSMFYHSTSNALFAYDGSVWSVGTLSETDPAWVSVSNTYARKADANTWGATQTTRDIVPDGDSIYDLGANATRWANIYGDAIYGDGGNLTDLNGSAISVGTVPIARLSGITSNQIAAATDTRYRSKTTSASELTSGTLDPIRLPVSWSPQETNSVSGSWTLDLSTNVYHRANMTGNVTNWALTVADTNALTVGRVDLYGANTNTLTVPTGWIVNGAAGSTYTNSFMSIVIETGMGATAVGKTRYSND